MGNKKSHSKRGSIPLTKEMFIERAVKKHGNKYDYKLVEYVNNKVNVDIVCPDHGRFSQRPNNHIWGKGCPLCKSSKGERKISEVLHELNIDFKVEASFDELLSDKGFPLRFDFGIESKNLLIEYDGKQHYEHIEGWITLDDFHKLQYHDKMKNEFCEKNNINLLRIRYDDKDIKNKVVNYINSL